jgi:hypothetical protein
MKRTLKTLPILWQRLVKYGDTCPRCGSTQDELKRAIRRLKKILRPFDIAPTLEIKEIDEQTFKEYPSESNRIWIAGKPLEEWVHAEVGASRCSSVCGDSNCRTVEVDGATFETIPQDLLIKAAIAAVEMVQRGRSNAK